MKEIIITSQAELDALPAHFEVYTRVIIQETRGLSIRVEARGNASVEAWGNASVVAWGNASVVAWENASVVAWENASVVAWGNASVEAWENASVVAWENASVVARGNVLIRIWSNAAKIVLHGFAVAFIAAPLTARIKKESPHAHIQTVQDLGWFERNGIKQTEVITLYKRVSAKLQTQEGTVNETTWTIGATLEVPSWNPSRSECGKGKFHACSKPYFCDEFRANKRDRYIAIEVRLKDIFEWKDNPSYPYKIGFRCGKVLYECDRFGAPLS